MPSSSEQGVQDPSGSNPTTRKQQTERPHVREQCPSRAPHSDVHHVCAGTTSRQAGRPTEFSFCRADTMLDTRRAATDVDRRSSSGAALEEPPFFHANPPRANTRNASAWVTCPTAPSRQGTNHSGRSAVDEMDLARFWAYSAKLPRKTRREPARNNAQACHSLC